MFAGHGELGAQVAQLVEHVTENHGVGGSIPPLGTMPFSAKRFFLPPAVRQLTLKQLNS